MIFKYSSILNLSGKSQTKNFPLINNQIKSFKTELIKPIVNKNELDNIQSQDPRHYQLVNAPDGTESNSFNYHPKIHKFSKILMRDGNANLIRTLIDKTLYKIKVKQIEKFNRADKEKQKDIETKPIKIFLDALENCKPILKLMSVKKGGITYQCPVPMSEKEREFKAAKLLISSIEEKDKNMRFWDFFAQELIDASQNQGRTIKKKIDIHKLAEANRAYAHYRWQKR